MLQKEREERIEELRLYLFTSHIPGIKVTGKQYEVVITKILLI